MLTGITNERGTRYVKWTYDTNGRALTSAHGTNADIERVEIAYSAYSGTRTITTQRKSAVTGLTTPIASTYTTHTGGGAPLVADISGPGCSSCGVGQSHFEYDAKTGDLQYKTEHNLKTSYGNYDSNGNPGYIIEADGKTEQRRSDYTYDTRFHNKVATITEPSVFAGANKITTNTYDAYANLTATTVNGFTATGTPVSRTITYQYTGQYYQLTQVDGPRTDVSDIYTLSYYPTNYGNNSTRVQTVTAPNGLVLRNYITYTATGKIQSEYRSNLYLTYSYYSGNDRLQKIAAFDNTTFTTRGTEWTYLPTGEVQTITQGAGSVDATTLTLAYDSARRLTRITDGLGNYLEYTLDSEGNVEKENIYDSSNNLKKTLSQTFDNYNRLNAFSESHQANTSVFSADGTLDKITDGKSKVTDYSYDTLKRLTSITQDLGGSDTTTANALTQLVYDSQNNLTKITDANNAQTSYVYDDLGNVLSQTSADTGTTTFSYNATGNVLTRKTANAHTFTYTYDALNRVTSQDTTGTNEDITFGYDTCSNGSGRLCSVSKSNVTLSYSYDALGNVTAHQGVNYSYDNAGRVKTITYPSTAVVTYNYNTAGQVSSVQLKRNGVTTNLASNATHQPFGAVNNLLYGNGLTLAQTFADDYRLQSQTAGTAMAINYTQYDANGNLQQRNSDTFSYDAHNRLDIANGAFGSRNYDYNKTGNRSKLVSSTTTNYTYAANSNRLSTINGAAVTLDANGNLTNQGARLNSYSPANQLMAANNSSSPLGNYQYNGLSQRVSKNVSSKKTTFSYGLNNELLVETFGNTSREYIYLDGQPLAIVDNTAASNVLPGIVSATTPAIKGSALSFAWSGVSAPTAYDWVGIYPVGAANSWSGLDSWMYTNGATGGQLNLNLKASDTRLIAGQQYELRLYANDSYSRIATSAAFTLNPTGPTVVTTTTPALAGSSINVAWSGITNPNATDWIAIIKVGAADGSENEWKYTNGTSSGSLSLPLTSGLLVPGTQYEVRLYANNDYILLASGGQFTLASSTGSAATSKVYYIHNDQLGTPQALTNEAGTKVWSAVYDPYGNAIINK